MEAPRAPEFNEYSEIIDFLNKNLRAKSTWSVIEEYPTVFTEQNRHNIRIIKGDHGILSHAVIKPLLVKTRRGLFKVGCIGSVITDEKHRNLGLSQNVINECLEEVKKQGCDFAVLWTNLFDFYRKMGFELAGSEVSLLIDRPLIDLKKSSEFKILNNTKVDPQALMRVYAQHSVTSFRSLDDFEKYLKIPNSRLYTAWDKQSRLAGYAVEGKGADLQGYIHEWGGSLESIMALTNYIQKETGKNVTLITPAHSQNLIRYFESLGVKKVDGFLGMIKMTNPQLLFAKVIRNIKMEWGIENFVLENRSGEFFYGIGEHLFKTDSEADIIKLLFGPQSPSKLNDHGVEMNEILDNILPLEMWIWGWDSI